MAAAAGPTQLLQVCGQRLDRFVRDAQRKRLAWLREAEEQGLRLLHSDLGAEPEPMPRTPWQRRRPRKRQSSCPRAEHREPSRRRLSRRRSGLKPVSSKPGSQRRHSKEQPQNHGWQGAEVPVPGGAVGSQAGARTELPAPPGECSAEAGAAVARMGCQDGPRGAGSSNATGDAATELHDACALTALPAGQTARDEEVPERRAGTSPPRAAGNEDPAVLQDQSPPGLEKLLLQDSDSEIPTARSRTQRRSGRRSSVGGPHKSRRVSLAVRSSLARKRESVARRSIGRASSRKAAAGGSPSASSRVSRQSSLEVFVEEDMTSSTRPGVELNPPSEKAPRDILFSSRGTEAASPPAKHLSPPEQQAGSNEGTRVNPNSEGQNENQEQTPCAKAQENPSHVWVRSCKQAMGALWSGQQVGSQTLSPWDDKQMNSENRMPPSSSSASKVVRPLKTFLQAVQRNQLLTSPGPTGHGGVIKSLIKCSTPTRPDVKGDFVEKERQRLESLRKKQEAEEQRRKKVEEEKRRRQAEMKQKREERLRKALQARERVEQMEEEKKKRMEQKILQNDEKVHMSQVREEKVAEERSKKKLSKKQGEADAWKQKVLRVGEDEFKQQEPLQNRREDKVKEKGKKVLELKNLVEQQQTEQMRERDHKQQGKEKTPQPQLVSAVFTEKNIKEEESPRELHQLLGQEMRAKQPESIAVASNPWLKAIKEKDGLREPQQQPAEEKKTKPAEALAAACGTWLSKTVKKSSSTSHLQPLKAMQGSRAPTANKNNYGMDLRSDDSTDDENEPRKPVPAWAVGAQLQQAVSHQYHHPVDLQQLFGLITSPKLENIFGKRKPRYFKRTSSAVWHSPPVPKCTRCPCCNFKK
ncbi:inner centromere protein-like [Caloenas nicobarica]|uniref:inner centromere protein-like n=1 Tax=Caloenas nicobarica TaxID=187106 RepID=UPI0032B84A60